MSTPSVVREILDRAMLNENIPLSVEVMAFCPSCKTFETVWFTNGALNQTRRFMQYENHIYHDCGSTAPCRLYKSI